VLNGIFMTAKEYEKSDLVRFSELTLVHPLSPLYIYIQSLLNEIPTFYLHNASLKIVNFTEIF